MTTAPMGTILLAGGTGTTGSRIAPRLRRLGADVRIGSRRGDPPFRWEEPATWGPALAGVRAAYIAYHPDLAVPGAAETVGAFARAAAAAGVGRIVLLSGRGEPGAEAAEREVMAAGAEWTILRCAWFAQDFEGELMGPGIAAGTLALPVNGVPEPFVDAEDIAEVAVAALIEDGHAGRIHRLTGPRSLRFDEAVAEIGRAMGRPVALAPVGADRFAADLADAGAPPELIGLLTHLFTEVLDGRNAHAEPGVEEVLGRPPRDFATYARRAADAGAWAA